MKVTFKIIITQEYKLNISIIDELHHETIIQENNKPNSIDFMKHWIENPDDFKTYPIHYQNKQYELLPEVFFAIIINEFKNKVEKEYIITNTEIQIPSKNSKTLQRINVSLDSIGLINLSEDEELLYDYTTQGEYLKEIIDNNQILQQYSRMIERAKQRN